MQATIIRSAPKTVTLEVVHPHDATGDEILAAVLAVRGIRPESWFVFTSRRRRLFRWRRSITTVTAITTKAPRV